MDLLDALAQSFDHAAKVVDGLTPDQLGAPTPCSEWDVRELLTHMLGVVDNVGRGARGEAVVADPPSLDADPGAQFRRSAEATLAAWRERGLEGEVNIGAGSMPAQAALSVNLLDTATHSWDLAKATGQDGNLPDDVAQTVLAVCHGFVTDEIRARAGFAAAVETGPGATPTEQLAAFLGRQP